MTKDKSPKKRPTDNKPSRRRSRTDKEKGIMRDRILESATELFTTRGYYGTTIADITRNADVSTGTFYLYYKSKIDIYKTLQLKGLHILSEMMEETLSRPFKGALSRLADLALTYYRFYCEHHEFFEIIAVLSATPAELKETESEISHVVNKHTSHLMKKIESVIIKGIKTDEIKAIDTWRIANVYWGMMDGLILLAERHNLENVIGCGLETLIKEALDMTFSGISKKTH
ncbi:MAG TPA: TetR/AcrR family transcriptional regulator [Desulfomonilia bacterium]